MATIVVDANGEAMLRKSMLERAGARAGDTVEVRLRVIPPRRDDAKPPLTWDDVVGIIKPPPGTPPLSIEEMNEVIAKGWAGQLDDHD